MATIRPNGEHLELEVPRGAPQRTDASVHAVIKRAVALKQITEEQGQTLFWLHGYGVEKNLSNSDLAKLMKVSDGTVSMLFSGKYGADDWTPMIARIEALKMVEAEEQKKLDVGFVMTETASLIHEACRAAMVDGMPAFIYGASQMGKTVALLEYQRRNNHGRTKYLRLGSRWTKSRLVKELAAACNVRNIRSKHTWELEERILDSLNRYNLLIVDEFHMALETVTDTASKEMVEYIREVYDRTQCGLVLCSTKVGLEDLENGKNKMLFDQLRRRGTLKVVLPDVPKVKDINLISRHFGMDIPTGETLRKIKELLKVRGLGVFVRFLQKTHAVFGKSGADVTWDNFFDIHDGYAKYAAMKNDY